MITYFISNEFDYSLQIAPDVGPAIADDYRWPAEKLPELTQRNGARVIDNRLTKDETNWLEAQLPYVRGRIFLRVVDDYDQETREHWWYCFLRRAVRQPNVHLIYTYQPTEVVRELIETAAEKLHIYAPYLYRPENEMLINHSQRRNAVIISGNLAGGFYPLRHHFWRMSRRSILWRPFSSILRHPGYPDVGQTKLHDIVGDRYISALSGFRYAFVCSGRARSEYLKYREIAYAGVCPVGDMPATLNDCPQGAYVEYLRDNLLLFKETILSNSSEDRARRFRNYMTRKRNREAVSQRVNEQIITICADK